MALFYTSYLVYEDYKVGVPIVVRIKIFNFFKRSKSLTIMNI